LSLPSTRFHRRQGIYNGHHFDLAGNIISSDTFSKRSLDWLPSDSDRAYVKSLMKPVHEPGKVANWIAMPKRGIHGQPVDFDYVRTDG